MLFVSFKNKSSIAILFNCNFFFVAVSRKWGHKKGRDGDCRVSHRKCFLHSTLRTHKVRSSDKYEP
jgi:hypothetical protein